MVLPYIKLAEPLILKMIMEKFYKDIQNRYSNLDNVYSRTWKTWINSNNKLKYRIQNFKWKNPKPQPGGSYRSTTSEQIANVFTHGLVIFPAVIAAITLFERSHNMSQYLVSWVYGGSLTMLFIISTFFHCSCFGVKQNGFKPFLHRCDRAMIYVFIASSYFPWLQLANETQSNVLYSLEWAVWVLAALGITYQQIFHERYKWLETVFYVIMGLGPALIIIFSGLEFNGMTQLELGGLFYILGISFFKADGVIPFAHAIWHLFVILAASFHYYAILNNLFPIVPKLTGNEKKP